MEKNLETHECACDMQQEFKTIPKQLLNSIQVDKRSITGSNIRRILLLTKKESIDQISDRDIDGIEYGEIPEDDN